MVVLSMLPGSRIICSPNGFSVNFLNANRSSNRQGNLGVRARAREIYTHTRDTGIKMFDQNMKLKSSGQWLPSYIESSPDISQKEVENLYKVFPEIVEDFARWPVTEKFSQGNQRTREFLEYAVAWSPVAATQTMIADRFYARKRRLENKILSEKDENERYRRAHLLAWCLELIIRPIYLNEDTMDDNPKRNGLPTWSSLPQIGLGAVNDAALMSQGGYCLLHKYFRDQENYSHLLNTVYDGLLVTQVGENDLKLMNIISEDGTTLECLGCAKRVWNAAAYTNICIIGAMLINGIRDLELERQLSEVGVECMIYGSMVDDYVDCFGGELVCEREPNSDIKKGKQTWLLIKAMELGNPDQLQRLKMNYGKENAIAVQNVLEIYKELNIKNVVLNMADDTYGKVQQTINQLSQNEIPVNIFHGLINHYRGCAQGILARI